MDTRFGCFLPGQGPGRKKKTMAFRAIISCVIGEDRANFQLSLTSRDKGAPGLDEARRQIRDSVASPQPSRKASILPKYFSGKPYSRDQTGMTSITGASADALFSSMQVNSQQLEYYAGKSLERGLDLYKKKDYSGAVSAFRSCPSRSTRTAQNAVGAAQYMSNAYLAMGDSENAIKSLKTFIEQNSSLDTAHANLAQFLFSQDRYEEAVTEYEKTVELNPSEGNRYALGQAYLQTGKYGKAEEQFMQVLRMAPDDPAPHLGLGQTYAAQGRYEIAIKEFKAAIDKKWDFYDAYAEMGYAYADMGEIDTAQGISEFLEKKAPEQADLLSRYLYKADPPKIVMAYADSTFPHYCPPVRRYRTSTVSSPPPAPPNCSS